MDFIYFHIMFSYMIYGSKMLVYPHPAPPFDLTTTKMRPEPTIGQEVFHRGFQDGAILGNSLTSELWKAAGFREFLSNQMSYLTSESSSDISNHIFSDPNKVQERLDYATSPA